MDLDFEAIEARIRANPGTDPLAVMGTWLAEQTDNVARRAAAAGAHDTAARMDKLSSSMDAIATGYLKTRVGIASKKTVTPT